MTTREEGNSADEVLDSGSSSLLAAAPDAAPEVSAPDTPTSDQGKLPSGKSWLAKSWSFRGIKGTKPESPASSSSSRVGSDPDSAGRLLSDMGTRSLPGKKLGLLKQVAEKAKEKIKGMRRHSESGISDASKSAPEGALRLEDVMKMGAFNQPPKRS
mmetsp:Transcript_41819/g.104579  ORF Transcript_41819/g.104579 Transcript_41819/m.104579 type:complete len:157 (+) Transcript_41819:254-724(+)|eukprot:CAMPEP_0173439810 /NCGR_PEP_ID=MMETSP1357-20121228/21620_1 /TAXON_ID=77926 /ORGANISM="Hemiselmis rufescens, Strain PCC563" /LENGTH=156 /DNA_ID=CAMNT_0014405211 /DNA_START=247 /DNA_END=717 /DNA_ORIENTATION=+